MLERPSYMSISPGEGLPSVVNAIIEIPKGRRSKFEIDKKTGLIRLDRYLYSSSHYPGDYGFIPQTLAEDGDALDILVMVNEPTFSGCLIEARVIGLFRMKDRGLNDFKILSVPNSDPLFAEYRNLRDAPSHFLREVEHFFATYKQLEGVTIETMGWATAEDAIAEVKSSAERYLSRS
jgi:inorganic pyrophosphatase